MIDEEYVPTAPPSYQSVDVVQEFALRYEKRKETIHCAFEKKRNTLEKQYQTQLTQLEKEKSIALTQLHASYVDWINIEPAESIPQPTYNKYIPMQQHSKSWLRYFWNS